MGCHGAGLGMLEGLAIAVLIRQGQAEGSYGVAGECSEAPGPTRTIRGRSNKRNRNRPVCVSAGCPQGLFPIVVVVVVPVSCSTAGRGPAGE